MCMTYKNKNDPRRRQFNRARMRRDRARNPEYYLSVYKRQNRLHRKRIGAFIDGYKAAHPCTCGETNPVVLDFHHRDPGAKMFTIGESAVYVPFAMLLKEVAKCDILCANCHRSRTAAERHLWARRETKI